MLHFHRIWKHALLSLAFGIEMRSKAKYRKRELTTLERPLGEIFEFCGELDFTIRFSP